MKFNLKIFKRKTDYERLQDLIKLAQDNGLLVDVQLNYKNEFIANVSNGTSLQKRVRVSKAKTKTKELEEEE